MSRKTALAIATISAALIGGLVVPSAFADDDRPQALTCSQAGIACRVATIDGVTGLFISSATPALEPTTTTAPTSTDRPAPKTTEPKPKRMSETRTETSKPTTSKPRPKATPSPTALPGSVDVGDAQRKVEAQRFGYGAAENSPGGFAGSGSASAG